MKGFKAALAMVLLSLTMPIVLLGLAARWVDQTCVRIFEAVYDFACETLLMGRLNERGECEKEERDEDA